MEIIDFRSDTVTLPTEEMRKAMYDAELGDDVYGEDPTVNKMEKVAADIMGTEAALIVPSGSMGNIACVLSHCNRGDEIILGDKSHIFLNEAGGVSALGGVHPHTIKNREDGTLALDDIKNAMRNEEDIHHPKTRLICLENTHNRCYGTPISPDYVKEVKELASEHELKIHMDGARIFNAAVALNIEVSEYSEYMDSVMFCLSKGLSAPVGSVICGSGEFIKQAKRIRKLLGGGMRQAGIIAAPGLIGLNKMRERLKEDHINAQKLASGLSDIPGFLLDIKTVRTNIIYFKLQPDIIDPEDFIKRTEEKKVKLLKTGENNFRMVTHYGINSSHIEETIRRIKSIFE